LTQRRWPPNPYDYSTPAGADVFAGRRSELGAFGRFAAAVRDGRIQHLLIHGPRSIGKTSLLGRLDEALDKQGLVYARVTLDDDSAQDSQFIVEAITALTNAAIRAGAFGGAGSEFDNQFQNTLVGAPSEHPVGPLRVLRFAAACGYGVSRISDLLVEKDLQELTDGARDVDSPGLVLVVDEANKLETQPVTVQRLRNLFITPGLIATVLCGSDGFLTALDTAMAPMSRHFERLNLQALADEQETRDAMIRPLQSAGVDYAGVVPPELIHEVHALSGGRPFEVSLLCHAMYDKLERGEVSTLALSDQVLEAVAAQLRPSVEDQAALAIVRTLEPPTVELAAAYCVDPQLTIHEHALLRAAFDAPTPAVVETARRLVASDWEALERVHLASVDGDFLRPAFGELGRLYLKYHAQVIGVMKPGFEGRFSERLAQKLEQRFGVNFATAGLFAIFHRSRVDLVRGTDESMAERFSQLRSKNFDKPAFLPPIPDVNDVDSHHQFVLAMIPFEITEDGFTIVAAFSMAEESSRTEDEILKSLTETVAQAVPYGARPGAVETVALSPDEWRAWTLSERFWWGTISIAGLWLSGRRSQASVLGESFLRDLRPEIEGERHLPESALVFLNNLGFVRLTAGKFDGALIALEQAATRGGLEDSRDLREQQILRCNLAAACAGLGQYSGAIDWCDQVLALDSVPEQQEPPAVLVAFTPDPDWQQHPMTVTRPDPELIALATRASAQACLGDATAAATAQALTNRTSAAWAKRVRAAIIARLGGADEQVSSSLPNDEGADEFDELADEV